MYERSTLLRGFHISYQLPERQLVCKMYFLSASSGAPSTGASVPFNFYLFILPFIKSIPSSEWRESYEARLDNFFTFFERNTVEHFETPFKVDTKNQNKLNTTEIRIIRRLGLLQ